MPHPPSARRRRPPGIPPAPTSAPTAAEKGGAIGVPAETTRTPCGGPTGSGTRDFPAIPIFYLCETSGPMMLSLTRNGQPRCPRQGPSEPVPVTGPAFNDVDLRGIISRFRLDLLYWIKLGRLALLGMTSAQRRCGMIVEDGLGE